MFLPLLVAEMINDLSIMPICPPPDPIGIKNTYPHEGLKEGMHLVTPSKILKLYFIFLIPFPSG